MQNEYFRLALKAEIESRPRGFRNVIAKNTGIQAQQITNIMNGVAYGSEERRRKLVKELGWESYDTFLEYGRSLSEGREYKRPVLAPPAPEAASYYLVPFHKKIKKVGHPGGSIFVPDDTEKQQPIMVNKKYVGKDINDSRLAAFQVLNSNMEPTIEKGRIVIIDLAQRSPSHGSTYLIAGAKDKVTINKIHLKNDDVYLINDNQTFGTELLKEPWDEVVVGKVIWTWLQHHN